VLLGAVLLLLSELIAKQYWLACRASRPLFLNLSGLGETAVIPPEQKRVTAYAAPASGFLM
jgi:hypothetical protein